MEATPEMVRKEEKKDGEEWRKDEKNGAGEVEMRGLEGVWRGENGVHVGVNP